MLSLPEICEYPATLKSHYLVQSRYFNFFTDPHDITEILLKVALNTITLPYTLYNGTTTCPSFSKIL
jgi:uncharacterized membrane protein YoaT (DUF817 family)